jgi:hypothetical protein
MKGTVSDVDAGCPLSMKIRGTSEVYAKRRYAHGFFVLNVSAVRDGGAVYP